MKKLWPAFAIFGGGFVIVAIMTIATIRTERAESPPEVTLPAIYARPPQELSARPPKWLVIFTVGLIMAGVAWHDMNSNLRTKNEALRGHIDEVSSRPPPA